MKININKLLAYARAEPDPQKSISLYQKALKSGSLSPQQRAWINFQTGKLYHGISGFSENAILSFQKAAEQDPMMFEAFYNLGLLLYEKGDFNEAVRAFQKALKINAKSEFAMKGLIHSLFASGNSNLSMVLLEMRIHSGELSSADLSLYMHNLGEILLSEGFPEEAREMFASALRSGCARSMDQLSGYYSCRDRITAEIRDLNCIKNNFELSGYHAPYFILAENDNFAIRSFLDADITAYLGVLYIFNNIWRFRSSDKKRPENNRAVHLRAHEPVHLIRDVFLVIRPDKV